MDPLERIAHHQQLPRRKSLTAYRSKEKLDVSAAKRRNSDEWKEMLGLRERRKMENNAFSEDHLKLIINIGTCHSPGGARAPLSRAASHLSSEMSCSVLILIPQVNCAFWVSGVV